jgi:uncharacterized membrane protein YtjA (UPF0391 family)
MGLLQWAILALAISLGAGALGFTGVAGALERVTKILFGVFLTLSVVMLVLVVLGVGAPAEP